MGPLLALDEDGDPVEGEDFDGDGELEVAIDGGAFGATAGEIGEIGRGYYYLMPTEAEAAAAQRGIAVKITGACEEFVILENIESEPQGITVGETDPDKLLIGPLLALNEDGEELDDLTDVDVDISINGSALEAGEGSLVMHDDGYPYYRADPSEVTERGWILVVISGACEEFALRQDIEAAPEVTPPEIEIVSPTPGVAPGQPGGFPRKRSDAIKTPIVLRVSDASPGVAYLNVSVRFYGSAAELEADQNGVEEEVYRRGSFRGKHASGSSSEMDGDDLVLTVMREGGWVGRYIKFFVDAIDGAGNLTE